MVFNLRFIPVIIFGILLGSCLRAQTDEGEIQMDFFLEKEDGGS